MKNLTSLISPMKVDLFLNNYWDKKYFYFKGSAEKNLQNLFGYRQLETILNSQIYSLRPHDIRLTMNGKVFNTNEISEISSHYVSAVKEPREKLSVPKVNELLNEGASLVISEVHESDLSLQEFAHGLKNDLGMPVSVSIVHSCKGNDTFVPHYDSTDLFIVQIDGQKEWTLGAYTVSPTKYREEMEFSEKIVEKEEKILLSPGDVLYMPSGAWHTAKAVTDSSLALSIGVHSKRKIDLAYAILNYYLSQNLLNDESLRKNLPLSSNSDESIYKANIKDTVNTIKEDIIQLLEEINDDDVVEFLEFVLSDNKMNRGFSSSFDERIVFPYNNL